MRKFQQILTVKNEDGTTRKGKYSYVYLDRAIEDANKIKDEIEKTSTRRVIAIDVINKETNDVVWSWEA